MTTNTVLPHAEPAFASLTAVVPDWHVASHVTAFSTTRLGGVSDAPYDALNLGLHVGDDNARVMENRRRLHESFAMPEQPRWLNQTHSTTLCSLSASESSNIVRHADGAYTQNAGIVLAILTADCLPVVISDTAGTQLAVVHAGWRGLAGGILKKALSTFPADADLHVWLGPAIGPQAFEVGEDVRQAFIECNSVHAEAFSEAEISGKYWANLYQLARTELQACKPAHPSAQGSLSISGGDYCTVSEPKLFHSHRRDGVRSGRMATIAWIGLPTGSQ